MAKECMNPPVLNQPCVYDDLVTLDMPRASLQAGGGGRRQAPALWAGHPRSMRPLLPVEIPTKLESSQGVLGEEPGLLLCMCAGREGACVQRQCRGVNGVAWVQKMQDRYNLDNCATI